MLLYEVNKAIKFFIQGYIAVVINCLFFIPQYFIF